MMSDIHQRSSFGRLVNYANNPKKARLIDSKDVRLDDNYTIARSMKGQADDKPGRKLKNAVYHISLDFAQEDTPMLTDELMAEIAREYMRRMGITNTQYIVCRHLDTDHEHMHIVANRVNNDGNTISDSNDKVRSKDICLDLTKQYGLHISQGKMSVKRERLRGKDKIKYQIYDAIKAALPHCHSWSQLCEELRKSGIQTNFRMNVHTGKITGVAFTKDNVSFNGSKVDRTMSFNKLDKQLNGILLDSNESRISVNDERFIKRLAVLKKEGLVEDILSSSHKPTAQKPIETDAPNSTTTGSADTDTTGSDFIHAPIEALIELIVQPNQVQLSVGGGGGNNSGWRDDNKDRDNNRNVYKPRRR